MATAANQNRPDATDELIALFDLAAALPNAWITVFESDIPGSEYVARLWATAKGFVIDINEEMQVLHVRKSSAAHAPAMVSVHLWSMP